MSEKIRQAKGVTGHLLDEFNGNYSFRVYGPDHSFVDYKVMHSDMVVTIEDDDTAFYTDELGVTTLDHAPETLGRGSNPTEPHPLAITQKSLSEDEKTLLKLWRMYAQEGQSENTSSEALGKTLRAMVAGSWKPPKT